jgi:hypothetical protein
MVSCFGSLYERFIGQTLTVGLTIVLGWRPKPRFDGNACLQARKFSNAVKITPDQTFTWSFFLT